MTGPRRSGSFRFLSRLVPAGLLVAVFGASLIAVAWATVLLRAAYERDDETRRVYRENGALARAFEEHVRRAVKTADNALLFLAMEYEHRGAVTQGMKDFVERAKEDPILNQIALADPSGTLLLSVVPHRKPVNISQREHFRAHVSNDAAGLFIGKPVITQVSGTWSFFLSRRLDRPDGSFGGIVSVGLDPKYFSDYYSAPELGEDRSMLLVGTDGIVRARHFRHQSEVGQNVGASPLFQATRRGAAGHYEVVSPIDGLPRFSSYRAMPDFPLVVVISSLKESALAPYQRRRQTYLLAASLFTLFVAGFCSLLVRAESRTRRHNERLSGELSERRKAEEALRESQSLFSAFMNHLPAVVLLKDSQGEILYTNEAFQELFGERMLGTKASELPGLDAEGAARMRSDDVRALAEGTILVEETIRDRGGRGRTFETRKFVIARTDKPPLLGAVSVDISKRRQAEEQRLSFERQMQQAQKMESLGILAGGIAHDFNNLLMGVLGNIDMALTKTPPESAVHTYLRRADTAAERAADLTNQMLAYSGKGRFVVEAIDLTAVVAEMAPLLATITSKRAAVTYRLAGGLPPVEGDATQIRQVVMNLITNASDALGDREGVIAVTTGVAQADSSGTSATGEPSPEGRRVYVEVSDNGCGMDRVTQARIFDPFFTTKQTGRGLGLAAVLGIVRGHGGEIRLTSEPGHGTTFRVLFPAPPAARPNAARATDGAADSATDASGVAAWKGPRTVLLVDDEETVRTATGEMLRECGFAVATASDGAEAVEVLRARVGEIAAVVLDVTMPRMGGEEAFRRMREIDARVPVILSSGFSEQDAVSRVGGKFSGAGFAGFIQKPYRTKELTELLEAAMAAAEGAGPGPTDAARLRPAR